MPNPPTPLHLKLLRGNPGKRPLRPEPEPTRTVEPPEPPDFLAPYAKDEWYRVAPELLRLGLLTILDTTTLAVYCQSYARWRTAEEAITKMAEKDPVTSGLLIKTMDGNPSANPLVRIASRAAADMVRYAGEFGMSAAARARIGAGVGYEAAGRRKIRWVVALSKSGSNGLIHRSKRP